MKNIHIPRKFFIIFAIAMTILGLFVGCVPNTGPNDDVPSPVDYVYYNGGSPGVYKVPVIKFEYNGHQYIRFGEYQSTCVVHDPDCKCYNTRTKTETIIVEKEKNTNNYNDLFDF